MKTNVMVGRGDSGEERSGVVRELRHRMDFLRRLTAGGVLAMGVLAVPSAVAANQGSVYWDADMADGLQAGNEIWSVRADFMGRAWCNRVAGNSLLYSRISWGENYVTVPIENALDYNGSDAVFYTSGDSTVTVDTSYGVVLVNNMTFDGTGYTIVGDTLTMTGGAVTTNQDATINAPLAGAGIILDKLGGSTLTIGGTNTYTGATIVTAGILKLAAAGALGDGTDNTTGVTVTNGAALDLNGVTPTAIAGLNLNGEFAAGVGALTNSNGTGAAYGGAVTLQSASSIGGSGGTITLDNDFGGAFGLTKVGSNRLILTGAANGCTTMTISAGIVQIGNGGTTGSLGSGMVDNNGNLTIDRSDEITIGPANAISGNGSLTQAGSGTTTLSGDNTYVGATTVNAGTLKAGVVAVPNVSGAFGNNSAVTMANVADAALDITGYDTQIGSLTGGGLVGGNVTLGAATLTVGGDNTTPAAYAGDLSGLGGGLVKIGSGTLTLSGDNRYSGNTTIHGGTLKLELTGAFDNSQVITVGDAGAVSPLLDVADKPDFAVLSGQTLQGIGTLSIGAGKTVTVDDGGHWAPGNSIGANNVVGNLALSGTSDFELGTPGASHAAPGLGDLTDVSGDVTLGGTLNLIDNAGANGQGSAGPGSYKIFTYGGVASGSFATINSVGTLHYLLVDGGAGSGSGQGLFLDLYRLAEAGDHTPEPVDLGNIHVGGSFTQQLLSITNTATDDDFSERLNASFGGTTGAAQAGGSFSLLEPQDTDSASLWVNLDATGPAGPKSGTATIKLESDGSGTSGWDTTALPDQTVNLSGVTYRYAVASAHAPEPVNLGSIHVGGAFTQQLLSIQNTAADDGYSEKLDASFSGTTGAAQAGGSFSLLAPQATDSASLWVNLDATGGAGPRTGTATIKLDSDGSGTSGLGTTALAGQTVNLTGMVYRYAAASAHLPEPVDLGTVIAGGTFTQRLLSIQNTAANDGYSESLSAGFSGTTGAVQAGGSFSLLAPQATDNSSLWVNLDATGAAGTKSGTATIALTSGGSGLGSTGVGTQTVNVTGVVLDHSAPSYASAAAQTALTLDFGDLIHDGPVSGNLPFAIWNRATTPGSTAKLNLDSITPISGDTGKFWMDLAAFSGLAAGSSNAFQARFNDTSSLGTFTATYQLTFSDEDLPGATSQVLTLTLSGKVVDIPILVAATTAYAGTLTVVSNWVDFSDLDADDDNCNDWVSLPAKYTAYLVLCYGDILCPVCPFGIADAWLWLVDKRSRQVFVASIEDGGITDAQGYCFGNGNVGVTFTTFMPYVNRDPLDGAVYTTSLPMIFALAGTREKSSGTTAPNMLLLNGGATLGEVSPGEKLKGADSLECEAGSELAVVTASFKKSGAKVKPDPYCPECSTRCESVYATQAAAVLKTTKKYLWWDILGEDDVQPR